MTLGIPALNVAHRPPGRGHVKHSGGYPPAEREQVQNSRPRHGGGYFFGGVNLVTFFFKNRTADREKGP